MFRVPKLAIGILAVVVVQGTISAAAPAAQGRRDAPTGAVGTKVEFNGVAFSPDGKHLGAASSDNGATIWDLATHQVVLTLRGHLARVAAIAYSPDGKQVATASWDT